MLGATVWMVMRRVTAPSQQMQLLYSDCGLVLKQHHHLGKNKRANNRSFSPSSVYSRRLGVVFVPGDFIFCLSTQTGNPDG